MQIPAVSVAVVEILVAVAVEEIRTCYERLPLLLVDPSQFHKVAVASSSSSFVEDMAVVVVVAVAVVAVGLGFVAAVIFCARDRATFED